MIDENGCIDIEGEFRYIPDECYINNQKVDVDVKSSSFKTKVHVNKGYNEFTVFYTIEGKEYEVLNEVYYEDTSVVFDKIPKENVDSIINTDKEIFNLSGSIKSCFQVTAIKINGNEMYNNREAEMDNKNSFVKKFDYNIKQKEGMNLLKFEYATLGMDFENYSTEIIMVNYKN